MHVKSIWTLRVDTFCRPPVTLMVIPSLSKRLFSERTLKMQILNPPSGYALGILAPLPSEKKWCGSTPALPPHAARQKRSSRQSRAGESDESRSKSRSEEHTSELQSLAYLVCRLLLEK